jgi:hypothetical protein
MTSSLPARVAASVLLGIAVPVLAAQAAYAGDAQVAPNPVLAGAQVEVIAQCPAIATSASISAATLGGASSVPLLSSAQNSGDWTVTLTIPAETLPGTYALGGMCSDGTVFTATVVVATTVGPMSGGGWAMGGPDRSLLAAGAVMLAAAIVGAMLLRRRPARR